MKTLLQDSLEGAPGSAAPQRGSPIPGSTAPQRGSPIPGSAAPQRGSQIHLGWHSRGYLPHFDAPRLIQHITYRLADALPTQALARLEQQLEALPADHQDAERRRRVEALLDAGHGACLLRTPAAARCVIETWLRFDAERYRLLAFVAMPNHCHVLIECFEGIPLAKIVNSWKSYTARWINGHVRGLGGRAGARRSRDNTQVWQRDYWDRYIRNAVHFRNVVAYIENNPVSAGLVATPGEWPWSSAAMPRLVLETPPVPAGSFQGGLV